MLMIDIVAIALCFGVGLGGGVKERMDSFGHCIAEKWMNVSDLIVEQSFDVDDEIRMPCSWERNMAGTHDNDVT